jgi:hypothetical protein
VYNVFDSRTVTRSGFRHGQIVGHRGDVDLPLSTTLSSGASDATTVASLYRVTPLANIPARSGGSVGVMPLDTTMTAHDSTLATWSMSQALGARPATSSKRTASGQSTDGRKSSVIVAVSRTPVLQAALVDLVLDELGALVSRKGTGDRSR